MTKAEYSGAPVVDPTALKTPEGIVTEVDSVTVQDDPTLEPIDDTPNAGSPDIGDAAFSQMTYPSRPVAVSDDALDFMTKQGIDPNELEPSFLETISASFRRENTVGSLLASEVIANGVNSKNDDSAFLDYQSVVRKLQSDGLELFAEKFTNPDSIITVQQYDARATQIRRELQDQRILEASGWTGTGTNILAAIADPVNFVPVGGGVKAARAGKALLAKSLGKDAVEQTVKLNAKTAAQNIGTGAAISSSLSEAALQATQETRTVEESALNIGGSFILGAVLGAGAYKVVGRKKIAEIESDIADEFSDFAKGQELGTLTGLGPDRNIFGQQIADHLARVVDETALDDGLVSGGRYSKFTQGLLENPVGKRIGDKARWLEDGLRNPILSLANSESAASRNFVYDFLNVPWIRKSDTGAVENATLSDVPPVATQVKLYRGRLAQAIRAADRRLEQNASKFGPVKYVTPGARDAFGKRVFLAMLNNGVDDGARDAGVEEVAKAMHDGVFSLIGRDLVDTDLLPVEKLVNSAVNWHVPRVYRRDVLRAPVKRQRFIDHAAAKIETEIAGELAELQARKASKTLMKDWQGRVGLSAIDDGAISARAIEAATNAYERIIGIGDREFRDYSDLDTSFLRKRTLKLDDKFLAEEGMIETNIFNIGQRYVRSAGTDAAIVKKFGKYDLSTTPEGAVELSITGDPALASVKKAISDEYNAKIKEAGLSQQEVERLIRLRDRDLSQASDLVDLARGTVEGGNVSLRKTVKAALAWNYVRALGGMVVSSLPDAVNITIANGLGRTVRHGVVPMLTNFKKAYKDADSDLRRASRIAGAVTEHELNSRLLSLSGADDPLVDTASRGDVALDRMARTFSKWSGITTWTSFVKQVAYNTAQARIIENVSVVGYDKLGPAERAWMNSLGIGRDEANRVASAWADQKKDKYVAGIPFADHEIWKDKGIANVFRAALAREDDNVVITPALGDKPTFASTNPVGQMMFQFKSYMFSSQARLFGRNLQLASLDDDKKASVYTGLLGLVMMAAMVQSMKMYLGQAGIDRADKDDTIIDRWKKNPGAATFDTLKASGFAGILFELDGISEKTGIGTLKTQFENLLKDESRASIRRRKSKDAYQFASDLASVPLGPTGALTINALSSLALMNRARQSVGSDDDFKLSRGEFNRARQLVPFQNVPVLQQIINHGQNRVGNAFEWPELGR